MLFLMMMAYKIIILIFCKNNYADSVFGVVRCVEKYKVLTREQNITELLSIP